MITLKYIYFIFIFLLIQFSSSAQCSISREKVDGSEEFVTFPAFEEIYRREGVYNNGDLSEGFQIFSSELLQLVLTKIYGD